jgi:nucleotide-binding universal stress UspA family protein
MLKHLLVAVDGSAASHRALRYAHDLAAQTGAQVTALTVIEPPQLLPFPLLDGFFSTATSPPPEQIAGIHAMLVELAAGLDAAQVHPRTEVGHPVDAVLAVADELDVDMIVLGARGLNPTARLLLGSTSDRVVHHAARPVLVVR